MKWDFGINGKLVRFTTKDGMLLHGFITPASKKKVLIYIPGFYSNFYDDFRFQHLAKELSSIGWSFFSANNRGHDAITDIPISDGKYVEGGTAYEKFENCLDDIKGAIDFVSRNGYSEIVLIGLSTGCQKIIYYQSRTGDKRVKGIILLGAVDDYNSFRNQLGKSYGKIIKTLKKMKKDELLPSKMVPGYLMTAGRFLSDADLKNPEARILNYDSEMEDFTKIKCPMIIAFGSKDQYLTKPVDEHFRILRNRTNSSDFRTLVINNTNHNFRGKEKELAKEIGRWLKRQ
ncbi:alpha/beta fold hydrolase [archaeon]|nr:MAG: alpha/beta fold hydrolase [archaeon]